MKYEVKDWSKKKKKREPLKEKKKKKKRIKIPLLYRNDHFLFFLHIRGRKRTCH